MIYCTNCFYPSSKPDLVFDKNGKCSACIAFESRKKIDWRRRKNEFSEIVKLIKKKSYNYDCLIPVSGGKDSTWQVLKTLEYGLKPLCVNARTCDLSLIGRENLDNIKSLGVDLIEVVPDQKIRHKLNKIGLLEVGDISWPEHVAIFTIPIKMAINFNIKYIFWGENAQNEYGGPLEKIDNKVLDRNWLEEFGGLLGLRLTDLKEHYDLSAEDLIIYTYPNEDEIKKKNLQSLFLGYFFEWDGYKNYKIAQEHGFKPYHKLVEGTPVSYENLDNHQTGIHDYFKFLKYGFGRTTDIANNLLRRKMISRKTASSLIKKYDGKYPSTYLGKKLDNILKDIDVNKKLFIETCDKFTNTSIFKINNQGKPLRQKDKKLIFLDDIVN